MPRRKDTAGKDEERQERGRKGPATQSRGERRRKPAPEGGGKSPRTVPKIGKRDKTRGDTSGDGLH